MAYIEITDLLNSVARVLLTTYGIRANLRYFRTQEQTELPTEPAYYLEPGSTHYERINVASPRVVQTVRFLSESAVSYSQLDARIVDTLNVMSSVARGLMARPCKIRGAYLLRAQTFRDAPSAYSVEGAETRLTVYGGVELEYALE